MAAACYASTQEAETRDPWSKLVGETKQISERPASGNTVTAMEKDTQLPSLAST